MATQQQLTDQFYQGEGFASQADFQAQAMAQQNAPRSTAGAAQPGSGVYGSASGTGVIPQEANYYQQLLSLNQQNYQNVQNAYQGGLQNIAATLPSIASGYQNTLNQTLQALGIGSPGGTPGAGGQWGVAAPAAQAIAQNYAQAQGQTQQNLINQGLGNTSAVENLQNQNTLNASQAYGGLGAQLAQTAAGYTSQIGMAQQGAAMQGLGMQSQLTQGALGPLGQQFGNTFGNITGSYGQQPMNYVNANQGYGGSYGNNGYQYRSQQGRSGWSPSPYVGAMAAAAQPNQYQGSPMGANGSGGVGATGDPLGGYSPFSGMSTSSLMGLSGLPQNMNAGFNMAQPNVVQDYLNSMGSGIAPGAIGYGGDGGGVG